MISLSGSKKKILEEIEKCDLVCSNCHRVRTCNMFHTHNYEEQCKIGLKGK